MIVTVVFDPKVQQKVKVPTSGSVTNACPPGSRNAGLTVPAMGSMCGVVSLFTNVRVDPRGTVTIFEKPVVRNEPPVTITTVRLPVDESGLGPAKVLVWRSQPSVIARSAATHIRRQDMTSSFVLRRATGPRANKLPQRGRMWRRPSRRLASTFSRAVTRAGHGGRAADFLRN